LRMSDLEHFQQGADGSSLNLPARLTSNRRMSSARLPIFTEVPSVSSSRVLSWKENGPNDTIPKSSGVSARANVSASPGVLLRSFGQAPLHVTDQRVGHLLQTLAILLREFARLRVEHAQRTDDMTG
jgi:hypothetical protein